MALGVSWMGWRHPAARHGQQRRGYSGRTSERSRDLVAVGRVTFEVLGDDKLGLRRSRLYLKRRHRRSTLCAKDLRRPRCGCSGGPTSLNEWWVFASQSADDMAPIRVAGFGYMVHAMPRCTNSPNGISTFN